MEDGGLGKEERSRGEVALEFESRSWTSRHLFYFFNFITR